MSKRRRSSTANRKGNRKTKTAAKLPTAAETIGFTDADEEFFRAGADAEHTGGSDGGESFDDLDVAPASRPGFWRRLFARAA